MKKLMPIRNRKIKIFGQSVLSKEKKILEVPIVKKSIETSENVLTLTNNQTTI
jgi:hypothetical protein